MTFPINKQLLIVGIAVFIASCSLDEDWNSSDDELTINSLEKLSSLFMTPPNQYRSAPLWVWNDDVTEDQIDQQLNDFKAGGMGGVFIHPRPGLITSYLSEEWFSLCKHTVEKAKELEMDVWLYDENSYPSGFAGGHVPAEMPESYNQGQGLLLKQVETLAENADSFFLVLKQQGSKYIDITNQLDKEKDQSGNYFLYEKKYYKKEAWHGGYSYVDLLYEGVTDKFIELTMSGHEKSIGSEFGKSVPGIFTDEPNISSPGGIRWTPSLFKDFQKRWGYDLKTKLPSLSFEIGEWKRIRHNYYTTLLELFIERWSKPWNDYTEKNNLNWTGHYWEHGWPNPMHGGDNMAMYAWHQMPAIDILMNQYSEKVNAQFGNVRSVKELRSVANQMGRKRTLSETYGAGGWDLRFEDMKRIGDWEYVLGVNFLNQHLSYMTLEGARKKDHPQSFSYHEPWWENYKVQGDYFARLSLALSSGDQINKILVIEPTSTAWMYFSQIQTNNKYSALGPDFQNFLLQLEQYQIEYDLASENIMKDIGRNKEDNFIVGKRSYKLIIIPPGLENLDKTTHELLKTYLQNGGQVMSFNGIPSFVDGEASDVLEALVKKKSSQWIEAASLTNKATQKLLTSKNIQFQEAEKINGKLFHQRRDFEDGQLLFLVNTSSNEWSTGKFMIDGKSVKELDLISGEVKSYKSKLSENSLNVAFDLPPVGSLLLLISNKTEVNTENTGAAEIKIVESYDDLEIKQSDLNVLSLDYCDIMLDGKLEKDLYYYQAADKIFRHYGFNGNPWSSAVQYKTSIIDQNNFTDKQGFEVSYSFLVDKKLDPSSLQVVIEHPELWDIEINSNPVLSDPSKHWLDRKFGVYAIGKHVSKGKNYIRLRAQVMSVHAEVEPVFILGDFSLEPQEKGWKLSSPKALKLGPWTKLGSPFYSEKVSYTKTYTIDPEDKHYIIKLKDWHGSVAEIRINKKSAGTIFSPPYELDITSHITKGDNEISILISGSLKNLLGPHHIGPVRGTAWPASFQAAPKNLPSGKDYDFIDYGLFEDFILIEAVGPPQKVYWKIKQAKKPEFSSVDSISTDPPILVSLSTQTVDAEIRYTLDGSSPNLSSKLYNKAIVLKKTSVVKAQSFKRDFVDSPVAIRNYYLIDKDKNGLDYHYYEGFWDKLPDFASLKEIRNGRVYDFNLKRLEKRDSNFAFVFSGYLNIEQGGKYTFYTNSNDGSRLYIGDIMVVDNDGSHSIIEKQGQINLKAGKHPIDLHYFDGGGIHELSVSYEGPGIVRQIIPLDKLMYK